MREEKNSFEKLCWERRGENRPAGPVGGDFPEERYPSTWVC